MLKALLFAAAVCGCALLYLHVAAIQSEVNDDMRASDQGAFMDFARQAQESGLQYTGRRNQMPLFPWILALFYSPEMTNQEFFEIGKRVNVWLSIVLLAGLGIAFFLRFSRLYAAWAVLCIAFLVFVIRSPFVQGELLYYSLFAFAFMLALSNLSAPTWRKSIAVGLLFGLAHFAKASALPALLVYCGSLGLRCLIPLLRQTQGRGHILSNGLHASLAALGFLAILFPYFQESRERYGSHLYNVNTTFYIWYDSWAEAKAGTLAAGDHDAWPDLPPEEIPGLEKYLREHSGQQIIERFLNGFNTLVFVGCAAKGSASSYGYCSQAVACLLLVAASLPLLLRGYSGRELLNAAPVIFFTATVFLVYALGAAWYIPVSSPSPRVILVLAAPLFWTAGLLTHAAPMQALKVRFGRRSLGAKQLMYGLTGLTLMYEIWLVLTVRAATMHGGY